MPRWTFAAGPWSTGPSRELTAAKGRKLSFKRGTGAKVSFSIDGRHPEALELVELETDVHAWRDGELLFRGRLGPTSDDVGDSHSTAISVGDYRNVLDRRFLYEGDALLAGTIAGDVGTIAWSLVTLTQARTAGALGITPGTPTPIGRAMAPTVFSAGQSIAKAIDLFAKTNPATTGFEWEISPELELNLYPGGQGRALEVLLDYGGIVAKAGRNVDPSSYANALRISGATGLAAETRDAADLALRPEGRWEAQISHPDAKVAGSLDGLADADLVDAQIFRPSYSVTLKPNRWEGPGALWLGDVVTLRLASGRLNVLDDLEVDSIDVDVSENGDETVTLVLGSEFAGFAERLRRTEDRLRTLERG